MKTLKKTLFSLAIIFLLMACSKSDRFWGGHGEPVMVTVPFKADFIGNYIYTEVDALCGEFPWMRIINEGGGTGTHLGKFTHHFDFCCDAITGIYPGGYMEAYFAAANGDILYVRCSGQVIEGRADDQPDYVISYFRDPFVILGGTGQFEGATGGGMTDDYNSNLDPYSHHHWEGTITLVKGKY